MAKQTINLGTMADNKSGDPLRTAFTKINENFTELYNRPTNTDNSVINEGTGYFSNESYGVVTNITWGEPNTNLQYGTNVVWGNLNFIVNVNPGVGITGITHNIIPVAQVNDTFTITGDVFGAATPADDITFTVTAIEGAPEIKEIDLTKQVHVLTVGNYHLSDGEEGQVLYFVPSVGTPTNWSTYIQIDNVLYHTNFGFAEEQNWWWAPFYRAQNDYSAQSMYMAIFTEGAWRLSGGVFD